jgi:esterase
MILHGTEAGQGSAVVLLHGLFGSSGNFAKVQRSLAATHRVVAFDLRNHGVSPHDAAMPYAAMAADVLDSMAARGIEAAAVLGHSMGGKVAMQAALLAPDRVDRLLVADIAPVAYQHNNRAIADALLALPLTPGLTRAAADALLASAVPEAGVRGFLLQNLRFGPQPAWRIGLPEIAAALPGIEGWDAPQGMTYPGPVLVLRGERSGFVQPEHRPAFRALFPAARFVTLRDAGHWLHADAPEAFTQVVQGFLAAA